MAEAVSSQPLTMEAQVHSQASQNGICGGQSGSGTGFFPVSMILSVLYTHISSQHLTALVYETFIHDENDY